MHHNGTPGARTDPLAEIASFTEALRSYPKEQFPVYYAMLQYRLGLAYLDLPAGERQENLQKALDAFHEALAVFSREGFPGEYARVQNSIGVAYRQLAGDRAANLQRAIACYQEALAVLDKDERPQEYGATQNNLGLAYAELPAGDRGHTHLLAIAAYQEALSVFTRDRFPRQYAATQYNLGLAYVASPEGDIPSAEEARQAIHCYEEALQVYTELGVVSQTALVRNSLGIAWMALGGDDTLTQAIIAFTHALRAVPKGQSPLQYAVIKNNLGLAYAQRGANDPVDLRRAVVAFQDALVALDPAAHSPEREHVGQNVRRALDRLAERGYPGTAMDHLAALVAVVDDEEATATMREQIDHWIAARDAPKRAVGEWVDTLLRLDPVSRRRALRREVSVLLERPADQMEQVLHAHLVALTQLAPDDQAAARNDLAEVTGELYGPQRMRVSEMLRRLGVDG